MENKFRISNQSEKLVSFKTLKLFSTDYLSFISVFRFNKRNRFYRGMMKAEKSTIMEYGSLLLTELILTIWKKQNPKCSSHQRILILYLGMKRLQSLMSFKKSLKHWFEIAAWWQQNWFWCHIYAINHNDDGAITKMKVECGLMTLKSVLIKA